jgi:hypothetical protein
MEIVMSPTHPRGSLCNSKILKDGSHLCNVGNIKKASFESGIESDTILGLVNFLMDYDSPRVSPFIQMTCEFSFWHENLKQYPMNSALAVFICKDDAHREKLVKQSDMQRVLPLKIRGKVILCQPEIETTDFHSMSISVLPILSAIISDHRVFSM